MDNQQIKETDWAWFAGFMDGEGTFTVSYYRTDGDKPQYQPCITVSNTCPSAVLRVQKIVESLGLQLNITTTNLHAKNVAWADAYHIRTHKLSSIQKILYKSMPYLVVKKDQAELLLRYVVSRMNGERHGLSEEELIIGESIRNLNKKGVSKLLNDYTLASPVKE